MCRDLYNQAILIRNPMLKIFGSVLNILEGKVSPQNLRPIENAKFRFALGGASFSDERGIGETLIIEGTPHISWVKEGKLITKEAAHAKSPFLMGVCKTEKADLIVQQTSPISLLKLYENLSIKYPKGFAILGSFAMETLAATYIKKAPVYRENINLHHEDYWAAEEHHSKVYVCLFGVVIPAAAKQEAMQKKWFERAFYNNPVDKGSRPFDSHTHAAFTDRLADPLLKDLQHLKLTKGVRHLLIDSVIQKGSFLLFPIDEVVTE